MGRVAPESSSIPIVKPDVLGRTVEIVGKGALARARRLCIGCTRTLEQVTAGRSETVAPRSPGISVLQLQFGKQAAFDAEQRGGVADDGGRLPRTRYLASRSAWREKTPLADGPGLPSA